MKKVFITLLTFSLLLAIVTYLLLGKVWMLNAVIAFVSSSMVMIASMLSYKNMVTGSLAVGAIPDDGRDTLDHLEDPYDLYDENINESPNEEKTLVEVVKEERQNLKKGRRSLWETTKDAKASFSFYRLAAYILLVLGFFYLNSSNILELLPYLTFLGLAPFLTVFVLMKRLYSR